MEFTAKQIDDLARVVARVIGHKLSGLSKAYQAKREYDCVERDRYQRVDRQIVIGNAFISITYLSAQMVCRPYFSSLQSSFNLILRMYFFRGSIKKNYQNRLVYGLVTLFCYTLV